MSDVRTYDALARLAARSGLHTSRTRAIHLLRAIDFTNQGLPDDDLLAQARSAVEGTWQMPKPKAERQFEVSTKGARHGFN
jgi:hypothetical protein